MIRQAHGRDAGAVAGARRRRSAMPAPISPQLVAGVIDLLDAARGLRLRIRCKFVGMNSSAAKLPLRLDLRQRAARFYAEDMIETIVIACPKHLDTGTKPAARVALSIAKS